MTFIEALNNETTRELIEQIEELSISLERYNGNEPTLERLRANLIAELAEHGYDYKIQD